MEIHLKEGPSWPHKDQGYKLLLVMILDYKSIPCPCFLKVEGELMELKGCLEGTYQPTTNLVALNGTNSQKRLKPLSEIVLGPKPKKKSD